MFANFDKKFWWAVFSLVGTTIGAGIFGLPYVFLKTGFYIALFELVILAFIVLLIQWIMGEIALRTAGKKRLTGYIAHYLGGFWKPFGAVSNILGGVGTLLVYIILGGSFLSSLTGLSAVLGSLLFFVIWFLAILERPKLFGKTEFFIGSAVILIVVALAAANVSYIKLENLADIDFGNIFLPYGVILFATIGYSVIPEMEEILGNEKRKLKSAITLGTLIPVFVYLIFIFVVLGVAGPLTSENAISGLARALNSQFVLLIGSALGFLAVLEAALSQGVYFKETLWYDFKLNKWLAWFLTGTVPLALFLLGARDFITIIGLVGAAFFGFQTVVILLIHKKAKLSGGLSAYEVNIANWAYYAIGAVVILGALLEIWHSL